MGSHPRIRGGQRCRRDLVVGLLQDAAGRDGDGDPSMARDRLSHGAPEQRSGSARAHGQRAACHGLSDSHQSIGVRESARANNIMVAVKLVALTLFLVVGAQHINTANYHPFAPNGFTGIHHGAAIVFFAYIGFDAISTAAEETKNPQRNLPIGILGGLAICTLIYILVGFVLTGMVPSSTLGSTADPLSFALTSVGMTKVGWLVALGAVFSMSAVLLVFQYGQPRIFFAMARDGLLPQWAAKIHPRTRIPWATTLLTGIFVATWSLVGDAGETYDLTNIGTLFAFILVSVGVLVLRYNCLLYTSDAADEEDS